MPKGVGYGNDKKQSGRMKSLVDKMGVSGLESKLNKPKKQMKPKSMDK